MLLINKPANIINVRSPNAGSWREIVSHQWFCCFEGLCFRMPFSHRCNIIVGECSIGRVILQKTCRTHANRSALTIVAFNSRVPGVGLLQTMLSLQCNNCGAASVSQIYLCVFKVWKFNSIMNKHITHNLLHIESRFTTIHHSGNLKKDFTVASNNILFQFSYQFCIEMLTLLKINCYIIFCDCSTPNSAR